MTGGGLAPDAGEIQRNGAAATDRLSEHVTNGAVESSSLRKGEGTSWKPGGNAGAEEGFAGVDVPDAGDKVLVQKFDFNGLPGGGQGALTARPKLASFAERPVFSMHVQP